MRDQSPLDYHEMLVVKRSLFEFGLDKGSGNSLNYLAPENQTHKKSFSNSFLSKRSHSSNRFSSHSRNPGSSSHRAPSERLETNKLWPFNEENNLSNHIEDDQKRITGFKNLDTLLVQQEIHQQNLRSAQKRKESRAIKVK